jgi:hypothetical protein
MHVFKHPKYYKELRKRNKSDQAISDEASTEATSVRPGPGLKQRDSTGGVPGEADISVTSGKQTRTNSSGSKRQATSIPTRVTSVKLQATSLKLPDS